LIINILYLQKIKTIGCQKIIEINPNNADGKEKIDKGVV